MYAVVYKNTGFDATSRLIAFIGDIPGMPFLTNEYNIIFVVDNGPNKLFRL